MDVEWSVEIRNLIFNQKIDVMLDHFGKLRTLSIIMEFVNFRSHQMDSDRHRRVSKIIKYVYSHAPQHIHSFVAFSQHLH